MTIPIDFCDNYVIEDRGYLTPCWIWQGATWPSGYGVMHVPGTSTAKGNNRTIGAHVYSYQLRYGVELPKGARLRHLCDVKLCVNWDHLVPGTQKQNIEDAKERGLLNTSRASRNVGAANPATKLTPAQVAQIRDDAARGATQAQLARQHNVSRVQVHRIVHGERWNDTRVQPALPERFCSVCGGLLVRYRHPCGTLESVKAFLLRKYCSTACRVAATTGHWNKSVEQLFWEKTDKTGGNGEHVFEGAPCHLWLGQITNSGYGQFDSNRLPNGKKHVSAHKFAWELANGPVPEGKEVHHRCKTQRCCNPQHLRLEEPYGHIELHRKRELRAFESLYSVQDRGYITPCHAWIGAKDMKGNAIKRIGKTNGYAHRWAYELHGGELLPGQRLVRRCGQNDCINLEHLAKVGEGKKETPVAPALSDTQGGLPLPAVRADEPVSSYSLEAQRETEALLDSMSISYESNVRSVIPSDELCIWIPEHHLAIDFSGTSSCATRSRRRDKFYACQDCGIALLQVDEHEWREPLAREVWKSIFCSKLGKQTCIHGRSTEFAPISKRQASAFLSVNHLQGSTPGLRWCFGLFREQSIVGVITFSHHEKTDISLTRLAFPLGTTVVGGAQKLFKNALAHLPSKDIVTFSNNRYSAGSVYSRLGFTLESQLPPSYEWFFRGEMWNKRLLRRKVLPIVLGGKFIPDETEHRNLTRNGATCVYDAGYQKWRCAKQELSAANLFADVA